MKFIDKIRKMTAEAIEDAKWPLRLRGISRAFESVIDGADKASIEAEDKLTDLRKSLTAASEEEARDIIKKIAAVKIELEEALHLVEVVKAERDTLNAEAN